MSVIIGSIAALLIGGGAATALASIPDGSGVIHGCYQPTPKGQEASLSVIDTAGNKGKCPSGSTELDWNQTGPQGPAGATGLQGSQGPAGPAGPAGPSTAGPSGLNTGVYAGGGSAFSYGNNLAVCPSTKPYALGGGVDADGAAVSQDEPAFFDYSTGAVTAGSQGNGTAPNAWFTQTVGGADNGGMAYVICAQ
jgi:hypothetical protein